MSESTRMGEGISPLTVEQEQRKTYYIGAWDACNALIQSPLFNKPQRAVIENHAAIVRAELETLGVTFTERSS